MPSYKESIILTQHSCVYLSYEYKLTTITYSLPTVESIFSGSNGYTFTHIKEG